MCAAAKPVAVQVIVRRSCDDSSGCAASRVHARSYRRSASAISVGRSDAAKCAEISRVSNAALSQLAPRVQWEHSYFTADKTFCIYLAVDEAAIRDHAKLSGFPASRITEVACIVARLSA